MDFNESVIASRVRILTIGHGLRVGRSQAQGSSSAGAGFGLFLTIGLNKGSAITVYDGELVHKDALPRFQASVS